MLNMCKTLQIKIGWRKIKTCRFQFQLQQNGFGPEFSIAYTV
jgi:hypothetical protein